ncbi:MAG: hypothetical protein U1E31_02190 [Rickettsiales bacterium]
MKDISPNSITNFAKEVAIDDLIKNAFFHFGLMDNLQQYYSFSTTDYGTRNEAKQNLINKLELGLQIKHIENNFYLHLNGFSSNEPLIFSETNKEIKMLKKYSKGIDSNILSEFMSNANEQIKIPNNSNIAIIIAAHGGKNNQSVSIRDDLGKPHEPQDIIKKIRETLQYNIQYKETLRDINIKFHSCYGLLMTQNKEAINELKKLSEVFPNSRVNLITEKLGAQVYSTATMLHDMGFIYPVKSFLNGETHPGTFLTEEEVQESKQFLIKFLELLYENEISPEFTIEDFMSVNENNMYIIAYQHDPYTAYNKYRKDIMNKIEGHLIHLGKNKAFIKELNDIQIENQSDLSDIDKLTKYINDYKFEVEKEPYILESKAFMEKLEEYQKKIENLPDNTSLFNDKSLSTDTKYESMESKYIDVDSIGKNKSNSSLHEIIDPIDKQKPELLKQNSQPDINNKEKRSNSVPRSSFVEKLKDQRKRSNSHSNRNR